MSKKTLKLIISMVVLVVIIAGVLVCGFVSRDENGAWFKNNDLSTWHWADPKDEKPVGNNNGISLLMSAIAVEDYEAYGISEQATSAKTVRAVFEPSNTTDKRVTWSIAWNNPESTFAKGKTVTDYVNIIPAENDQPYCSIEYLNNFGEYITLRCVSNANSELYATTTIQCIGKITYIQGADFYSLNDDLFNEADGTKHFGFEGKYSETFTMLPGDAGLNVVADYTFTFEREVVEYLRENYDSTLFAEDTFTLSGDNICYSTPKILQPKNKTVVDTKFWQALASYCVNYDTYFIGCFTIGEVKYYDGASLVWKSEALGNQDVDLSSEIIEQFTVNASGLEISGNVNFV